MPLERTRARTPFVLGRAPGLFILQTVLQVRDFVVAPPRLLLQPVNLAELVSQGLLYFIRRKFIRTRISLISHFSQLILQSRYLLVPSTNPFLLVCQLVTKLVNSLRQNPHQVLLLLKLLLDFVKLSGHGGYMTDSAALSVKETFRRS